MPTLRPATVADCEMILSLIQELAAYEHLSDQVTATSAKLSQALFGDPAYAEVILAEHDGQIAGFALYFHNFSTFLGQPGLYLEDLYVKPAFRGQGIGKRLITHLAHLADERGCGRLEWSVLTWNQPAIDFYERLGAVRQSDWTTYRLSGEALATLAAAP